MNELTKQNISNGIYKKNKREINANVISKILASEQTLQKMDSEKFMVSCITTLTGTLELQKEGVNIGHQLFCLSQELLQKRPKFKFLNFCYKFLLGIIFREVMFKECL